MHPVSERVAKGAQFLDQHDPEWWRADVLQAIDLDTLDLGSGSRCVLGQRCPLELLAKWRIIGISGHPHSSWAYTAYVARLSGLGIFGEAEKWAHENGFTFFRVSGEFATDDHWRELTAEWARVIRERRAAA